MRAVNGSMDALPFAPAEFDIIWAEGSLFVMGLDRALSYLKGFLKPGGYLAATELTWLRPGAPEELHRFWRQVGATIADTAVNLALFAAAGYELVGHFALPGADWQDDFYVPIERRLPLLRAKYAADPAGLAEIESMAAEIDVYRKYGEYYGYVFYVARKGN